MAPRKERHSRAALLLLAGLCGFGCSKRSDGLPSEEVRHSVMPLSSANGRSMLDSVPLLVAAAEMIPPGQSCKAGYWKRHNSCYASLPPDQTPQPGTVVVVTGTQSTLFDTTTDHGCEGTVNAGCDHSIDGGCMPFIDAAVVPISFPSAPGVAQVWLNVVNVSARNWFVKGNATTTAVSGLKTDCQSVLDAKRSPVESDYRGSEWLQGVFKLSASKWIALVHSEYYGGDYPIGFDFTVPKTPRCPSGKPVECWYGFTTTFIRTNPSTMFVPIAPSPAHLVARPATDYQSGANDVAPLYFHGTNVVAKNGVYYAMLIDQGLGNQNICPARTPDLEHPNMWRAWGGRDYNIDATKGAHCVGVPNAVFPHYLGYSTYFDAFILVGSSNIGNGDEIVYNLSKDMVHWSAPARLGHIPLYVNNNYPSLMDLTQLTSTAADPNANSGGLIGQSPWLLWGTYDGNNGNRTGKLQRLQVTFQK